MAAGRFAVVV